MFYDGRLQRLHLADDDAVCSLEQMVMNALANTHTHTQPFYGSVEFVRDNLGEPLPEETFTHSHPSWSSIIPYLLPPSITIHVILIVDQTRKFGNELKYLAIYKSNQIKFICSNKHITFTRW